MYKSQHEGHVSSVGILFSCKDRGIANYGVPSYEPNFFHSNKDLKQMPLVGGETLYQLGNHVYQNFPGRQNHITKILYENASVFMKIYYVNKNN